ncbi:uncharacterized protein LOC123540944 [Mercenaria mercenaria]|uniref:uncharacterized protein LOC123540944 n=1 Tax=Mercenaria mercenaria TaxID=6596 RepID=UPI001E1D8644|nr:uncharacterized protein LOC123540944 [Mercenaria mercenaria]
MNPRDDVCKTCEDFRDTISMARSEDDKLDATASYHQHVLSARAEREVYQQCVQESTALFRGSSQDHSKVHCTFDFSQYVKLPHHAREKGPTFFIQPRKVQMFGFRIDGYRQYNYLIDEDQTIGVDGQLAHGPDSVISMLDHAFGTFCHQGGDCTIHADNCFGQNKNRYVIAYLSWRTMTNRHDNIKYMMQLPGHTRCLIDAGFGRIKQRYRREDVDTLQHVADVVDLSSCSNVSVVYGRDTWKWRQWKAFFGDRYKKVPNISKYHYFRFTSTDPGAVFMKMSAVDTEETRFVVCKTNLLAMDSCDIPQEIMPAGLNRERQRYLYSQVRPLVRLQFQEEFCAVPAQE